MNEVLAIIPARGGSKGVPRKNLRALAGRPLVVHSIEDALQSRSVTRTVVSTDDDEIAAVALAAGAEVVRRPSELASDTASSESALLHVLHTLANQDDYRPDLVVFLQPTSPIRDPQDIDDAVALLRKDNADSLISGLPLHEFLWTLEPRGLVPNYDPLRRPRRQEMPKQFRENGSLYVSKAQGMVETGSRVFGRVALLPMNAAKSHQIDHDEDFAIAEALMEQQQRAPILPLLSDIRFLVFDFDGVWTNNQVLVLEDGTEGVLANRSDGLGLNLLRESGMDIAVLTAETNPAPRKRCEKLKIPCYQAKDKLPTLKQMLAERGVDARNAAFVGNDINDIPCMTHVGVSIAVADALPAARRAARLVTSRPGGFGAVREVVDWFLESQAQLSSNERTPS